MCKEAKKGKKEFNYKNLVLFVLLLKKGKKEFNYKNLVLFILLLVTCIFGVAIFVYVKKFGFFSQISTLGTLEQFGSFGDFIGGIMNPLLQFIVIAMLFWSIQVQRKELSISNSTLNATKDELRETKDANNAQAIELKKQTVILQSQKDDSLDQIKVSQELAILRRQKLVLEGIFSEPVSTGPRSLTVKRVMDNPNIDNNEYLYVAGLQYKEYKVTKKLAMAISHFDIGLRALLGCKNIPLTALIIEIEWFVSVLNQIYKTTLININEIVIIKGRLKGLVNNSTISEDNKLFFLFILDDNVNINSPESQ